MAHSAPRYHLQSCAEAESWLVANSCDTSVQLVLRSATSDNVNVKRGHRFYGVRAFF